MVCGKYPPPEIILRENQVERLFVYFFKENLEEENFVYCVPDFFADAVLSEKIK